MRGAPSSLKRGGERRPIATGCPPTALDVRRATSPSKKQRHAMGCWVARSAKPLSTGGGECAVVIVRERHSNGARSARDSRPTGARNSPKPGPSRARAGRDLRSSGAQEGVWERHARRWGGPRGSPKDAARAPERRPSGAHGATCTSGAKTSPERRVAHWRARAVPERRAPAAHMPRGRRSPTRPSGRVRHGTCAAESPTPYPAAEPRPAASTAVAPVFSREVGRSARGAAVLRRRGGLAA